VRALVGWMCLAGRIGKAEYGEASGYPLASFSGQRWHWAAFMRCGATACTRRCSLYLRVRHTVCEATGFYDRRSFFDVAFFLSGLCSDNCYFCRRLHNKYILELELKK
jgi:hypothetical protein